MNITENEIAAAGPTAPPSEETRNIVVSSDRTKYITLQGIRETLSNFVVWLLDQSPPTIIALGSALGFVHGCLSALLFPRIVSFSLFAISGLATGLAAFALREFILSPKERDSITMCGVVFALLSLLFFIKWLLL